MEMNASYIQTEENLITFPKWKQYHEDLEVGFTTTYGGCSKAPYATMNMGFHVGDEEDTVLKNRSQLAQHIDFPLDSWVCGEQVHNNRVRVVSKQHRGQGARDEESALEGIDGIITKENGILCTAFFADCVPLFFFDPHASIIGIAHAGWKGSVLNIGPQMIDEMIKQGASTEDIHVMIGPAISQEKYEVDDKVIRHIPEKIAQACVKSGREGHYFIDLHTLNMEILLQYGILRHNIDKIDLCTYSEKDMFYSHRRDHGVTGRMLGYIGFKEK